MPTARSRSPRRSPGPAPQPPCTSVDVRAGHALLGHRGRREHNHRFCLCPTATEIQASRIADWLTTALTSGAALTSLATEVPPSALASTQAPATHRAGRRPVDRVRGRDDWRLEEHHPDLDGRQQCGALPQRVLTDSAYRGCYLHFGQNATSPTTFPNPVIA